MDFVSRKQNKVVQRAETLLICSKLVPIAAGVIESKLYVDCWKDLLH